ncbi:MAG: glycosyltransferase family 2 protein [Selenomonadaceae bacterium]|nr:glycosyltransferase family 2 protein [Selenomonadaceae bacterium]
MIDKNLFVHDLSIVTIFKNEAQYLEEWLNYHLAAGVDHFYLYDNDSTDDTREVLEPYIDAELVDYFPVTGELMMIPVYNDAIRRFKFATRYMAFLDVDEFIFPKTNQSIVEVVDEILSRDERAAALAVNWQVFGSNNLETADLEKGVLERFTRRAPQDWFIPPTDEVPPAGNIFVKTIANPRFIRSIVNPHFAFYFDGKFAINSAGGRVSYWGCEPVTDKIVINNYFTKSKEEFLRKSNDTALFDKNNRNDEFDDDILNYQGVRVENYVQPPPFEREKYFKLLEEILLPAIRSAESDEVFQGKLETFLTCRALAGLLKRNSPKDNRGKFMEEAALRVINRTYSTEITYPEIMMMLNSLPSILSLSYPIVDDVRQNCISFVRQIMDNMQRNSQWEEFVDMGNYLELLLALNRN